MLRHRDDGTLKKYRRFLEDVRNEICSYDQRGSKALLNIMDEIDGIMGLRACKKQEKAMLANHQHRRNNL